MLIDSIDRTRLPATKYPFVVGDELVSVDGKPVADLLKEFQKYSIAANPRSTARLTANFLVNRYQQIMPLIADLGESATVVINRAGGDETYNLPWIKTGRPIREAGPVVTPKAQQGVNSASASDVYWDDSVPAWMFPIMPLLDVKIPTENRGVLNFGSRTPIFALPTNFVRRLGGLSSDVFYSGTFAYDGLRIGFIRIPDFTPTSATAALQQFEAEIRFFQQNTDGLIVDVMRNPGGSVAYDEALLQRLIPYNFRTLGFEIRATSSWLYNFIAQYENAKALGAPDWVQTFLAMNLDAVTKANSEVRGRTGPVELHRISGAAAGQRGLHQAADGAGRRDVGLGRRCLPRRDPGQQARADLRLPHDGSRRQRGHVRHDHVHRGRHQRHDVADEPHRAGRHQRLPGGAVCRKHRRSPGHRGGLHDSRQPHEPRPNLRREFQQGDRRPHSRKQSVGHSVARQIHQFARSSLQDRRGVFGVKLSTLAEMFIEQNFGPHIEQKCASLKPSSGSVSSCMARAVSGSSDSSNCRFQSNL